MKKSAIGNNASPKQSAKQTSPNKPLKKNSNSVHSTPKDENRPPTFKQKPLTFYFEQKSKGVETNADDKLKENESTSVDDVICSPTPIKKAKIAIGNRIESPRETTNLEKKNDKREQKETMRKPIWRRAESEQKQQQTMVEKEDAPAPDYVELSKKRVKRLYRRLKMNLNNLDKENFLHEMKSAALLNEEQICTIPNQLIRYLVKKEANQHKMEITMRNMSLEKRKNYRRELKENMANWTNFNFDNLYNEFLAGKYEDSKLALAEIGENNKLQKDIPKFVQMFPMREDLAQQFGRTLGICQFFNVHCNFLHLTKWKISATKLLAAIGDGKQNEIQSILIDSMLKVLVNFLTKGKKTGGRPAKVEVQERCLRSRDIKTAVKPKPNAELISSIKHLLEMQRKEEQIQMEEFVKLSTALTELDDSHNYQFFCFNVEGQISLLENLIDQIIVLDSFHNYQENDEIAENEREQNELNEEMEKLQQELKDLEKEHSEFGDLTILTRRKMGDVNKNEQRQTKIGRELEDLEEQLAEAKRNKRLLEFIGKYRIQPLGQDRFHRYYWFFADSPDGNGIYVQQQACPFHNCPWSSTTTKMMDGEEKENNKMEKEIILMEEDGNEKEDEECKFMEQIQEKILGRPCSGERKESWWKIENTAEFNELMESLMGRGRREHHLKRTLMTYKDLILERLKVVESLENEEIFDAQN